MDKLESDTGPDAPNLRISYATRKTPQYSILLMKLVSTLRLGVPSKARTIAYLPPGQKRMSRSAVTEQLSACARATTILTSTPNLSGVTA